MLVNKLFVFLSEQINEDQKKLLDQVIACLETIVIEGSKIALENNMDIDTQKESDDQSTLQNVCFILENIMND